MAISRAPVSTSVGGPHTTTTASLSPAPVAFLISCHSAAARVSLWLSLCTILGSVVRQAITRTRSEISRENAVSVWVGQRSRSRKPTRFTPNTTFPSAMAVRMGWKRVLRRLRVTSVVRVAKVAAVTPRRCSSARSRSRLHWRIASW